MIFHPNKHNPTQTLFGFQRPFIANYLYICSNKLYFNINGSELSYYHFQHIKELTSKEPRLTSATDK